MLQRRDSGLYVPLSRSYDDSLSLITSGAGLANMSRTLVPVVILDNLSGVGNTVAKSTGQLITPPIQTGGGTSSVVVVPSPTSAGDGNQFLVWTMTAFAAGADSSYHLDLGGQYYLRDFQWTFASGTGAFQAGYPGIFLWFLKPSGGFLNNFGPSWASNPGSGATPSTQMIIGNAGSPAASTNYVVHLYDAQEDVRDLTAGTPIANTYWPGILQGTFGSAANPIPWISRHIPHVPLQAMSIRKILGANADDVGRWQAIFSSR